MKWKLSSPLTHSTATILNHLGHPVARVYAGDTGAQDIINHQHLALRVLELKEDARLTLEHHPRMSEQNKAVYRERLATLQGLIDEFKLCPHIAGGYEAPTTNQDRKA